MKPIYAHFIGALTLPFLTATNVPTPALTAGEVPTFTIQAPAVRESGHGHWLDAPRTPGDWNYVNRPHESFARFGMPDPLHPFMIRCEKSSRQIGIARRGESDRPLIMRVRTETRDRVLSAVPLEGWPLVAAPIDADDPLLDAMALSKGRIAIEVEGMQTLYIPAWAEITRVIEDCR